MFYVIAEYFAKEDSIIVEYIFAVKILKFDKKNTRKRYACI